jgi:hypothetical protein
MTEFPNLARNDSVAFWWIRLRLRERAVVRALLVRFIVKIKSISMTGWVLVYCVQFMCVARCRYVLNGNSGTFLRSLLRNVCIGIFFVDRFLLITNVPAV